MDPRVLMLRGVRAQAERLQAFQFVEGLEERPLHMGLIPAQRPEGQAGDVPGDGIAQRGEPLPLLSLERLHLIQCRPTCTRVCNDGIDRPQRLQHRIALVAFDVLLRLPELRRDELRAQEASFQRAEPPQPPRRPRDELHVEPFADPERLQLGLQLRAEGLPSLDVFPGNEDRGAAQAVSQRILGDDRPPLSRPRACAVLGILPVARAECLGHHRSTLLLL
jgi:hypothetical protein